MGSDGVPCEEEESYMRHRTGGRERGGEGANVGSWAMISF